ncbi:MAG: iron ABC transporter permease [Burkholderiaceae bacterium]|nr:iron ABC transporter permease [Burkholderiaceae bacterium]
MNRRRPVLAWALTVLSLAAALFVALATGPYPLAPADIGDALRAALTGEASPLDRTASSVLWQIRLPRIAAALVVGLSLSAAGATFQTLFRNPLVSPDILGVSAGAALGAAAGIFLAFGPGAVQAMAFAGGLVAVFAVHGVSVGLRAHDPLTAIVLVGIAIGSLLGAAVSLLKYLADPNDELPAITYWLLGSLASVTTASLYAVLPAVLAGVSVMVLLRWRIGVLSLGDDEARSLGVSAPVVRAVAIGAATLVTAAAVSICGIVGWVGLVVPHAARMLVGPAYSRLLPMALFLGAAFVLAVDTLARTGTRIELPLGVLTAVIGTPLFVALLARTRRGWQ